MPLDRPIPAFYCCYLLRSTVRHGSVYVGSTPNPVRRLRQHNGLAKGGAVRTSRQTLRPWEMTCIVTGFPSHIAALQFEWAWQNPHITQHIAPESRIQHATQKKRSGQPKRPRHSVPSLLSNLHVLLRSPSFSRWPLEIRFFSQDVYQAWLKWDKATRESIPKSIPIIEDFPTPDTLSPGRASSPPAAIRDVGRRMAALPINFQNQKQHVLKAKEIVDFEQEGNCAICKKELEHNGGLYTICPNPSCESVTHISCLGAHFLKPENNNDEDALVPLNGTCPTCKTELKWISLIKELTLRTRGEKELQTLLKDKKPRKRKNNPATEAESEEDILAGFTARPSGVSGDDWHIIDYETEEDTEDTMSNTSTPKNKKGVGKGKEALGTMVEDSDWDEAILLS